MSDAKPRFNPNQPFQVSKPKFDPNQPFQINGEEVNDQAPETSILNTVIDKVAQAGTGGFADEISGGMEALGQSAGVKGLGGKIEDIGWSDHGPTADWEVLKHAYMQARDKDRKLLKQESEDHPIISGAAELAGGVMSPINKILPSSAIKAGATLGAVNGLGNSDADNALDAAKDTAIGAGLGAGAGVVADKVIAPAIEKATPYISEKLGDFAERRAAKALGATKAALKREGGDQILQTARGALDEGIITPMSGTEEMMARAQALKDRGGKQMEKVYKAIDDAGASTFNPLNEAVNVENKIGEFYRSPINRGETNQLENTLESMLLRGDKNIPLSEAQALKEELGKVANWKNKLNITDKEKMARDAYGVVNEAIDRAAQEGSEKVGISGLKDSLQKGKDLYKVGAGAEKLLDDKASSELGNKMVGLTDTITGVGGYAAMGPKGLLALAAKKGAEKYGNQLTATGADAISKALQKSPEMLQFAQKNPAAFQELVHKLESHAGAFQGSLQNSLPRAADQQPEAMNFDQSIGKDALLTKTQGSKYNQVLQNAANHGDDSLAAAHFVLSQRDQDYRKLVGEDQ